MCCTWGSADAIDRTAMKTNGVAWNVSPLPVREPIQAQVSVINTQFRARAVCLITFGPLGVRVRFLTIYKQLCLPTVDSSPANVIRHVELVNGN